METARRFAEFADAADAGGSSTYAAWATGVAADESLVALVERVPESQRQPVLVFAVARILGAPVGGFEGLRDWLTVNADRFVAELSLRHTQTNDVRRVAPLALALSNIDGPLALLEVGASMGLGLQLDRYATRVTTNDGALVLGDPSSRVRLDVRVDGSPRGLARLPAVAFRAGTDVAPLSPVDPSDALWLETLLWPGQDSRVRLLKNAIEIAAKDPTRVRSGDAVDSLTDLVAGVPAGTTPVVVTSGTLVYLPGARRQAFVDRVAALGVRWISYERTGLLTGIHATLPPRRAPSSDFATLALDGRALALGDAHGTHLTWLAS